MPFQEYVSAVLSHELVKSAITVAVRKVRGRVGRKRLSCDSRFERLFRDFAEEVSALTLAPVCDDLSCVGVQKGWRRTFADDTDRRLRSAFGKSLARCFPALAAARPDMDLGSFVYRAARRVCREMSDTAPSVEFVRDALWDIVNVTAQVSRCVSGDLDPLILVDPSVFVPLRRPAPVLRRALPPSEECN